MILWSQRRKRSQPLGANSTSLVAKTVVNPEPGYSDKRIDRYVAPKIDTKVSRFAGTKLMISQRWISDHGNFSVAMRGIPYITNGAHLGGTCLFRLKCTSAQWFSTTVRAVMQALHYRNRKRESKWHRRTTKQLLQISLLYVLTNDDNLKERLFNCRGRQYQRLYYYHYKRVDDPTRFCIDQAIKNASWFEFRRGSKKPRRVQSTVKFENPYALMPVYMTLVHKRLIRQKIDDVADPWICASRFSCKGRMLLSVC